MTGVDSPYFSRDDESEAERLAAMNAGVGDTIYLDPDQVNDYALVDLGMQDELYR